VATAEVETPDTPAAASENAAQGLPRLLDLGATKCIPCKMMAPILEELKKQYTGVFAVEFIDVWENPAEAEKHGIQTIPTQIFFDASGKELFRHVGFFSKEEILAKWKEFGVERKEGKDV
jgi:thioredoxin 1